MNIQRLDKYGNSSTDLGPVFVHDKYGRLKHIGDTDSTGTGPQGPQGPANGPQGAQGPQGEQGFQGDQGLQGTQGFQGDIGPQGDQGFQGSQGIGTQGFQGTQGTQGRQGAQGTQGFQGVQGTQGFQGAQGTQGFQGAQGTQGYQGTGTQGAQGTQGFQGAQGTQGFQGAQGTQGFQGAQGTQGFQGGSGITTIYKDAPLTGDGTIVGDPLKLAYNTDFTLTTTDVTPSGATGLSLQLAATTIVQPTIAGTWSIYNNNGSTPFGPITIGGVITGPTMPVSTTSTVTTSNTIIPRGAKLSYSGVATIPIKGATEGYQTAVTGNYIFSPTPPVANATSNTLTTSNLTTTTSYTIGLSKLKTGLIVVNSQVVRATGNDTSSATHTATFNDVFYWGYLFVGPPLTPITQADVDGITASQIEGLGNYRFGTKSQAFTVNDSTANGYGPGWRVVFAYTNNGSPNVNISTLTVSGSTFNQNNAVTRATNDITITTITGITAIYRVYVANASAAFNTTITIT